MDILIKVEEQATKRIALDAKKRTIKGTETYSDVAIKGK